MGKRRAGFLVLAIAGAGVSLAALAAEPQAQAKPGTAVLIQAEAPPFSDGIYPCSSCHNKDLPPNPERRDLAFHDEQQAVLSHGPDRWCLDCHDLKNRDLLHLTNGTPVPYAESYRLCGQCHGDKLRDWKVGIHGKRVGRWDGEKVYFLCVNCHNPHSPRFKGVTEVVAGGKSTVAPTLQLLKPEPRPVRPEEQRR
jgi:hypothetical protein